MKAYGAQCYITIPFEMNCVSSSPIELEKFVNITTKLFVDMFFMFMSLYGMET